MILQIVGISCYLGVFFWMAACIYQEAGKVQSLQYIRDIMIHIPCDSFQLRLLSFDFSYCNNYLTMQKINFFNSYNMIHIVNR